ncbi:MAG TPA: alpha/beta hydrolase [Pseudonocardiaceae bacterium]
MPARPALVLIPGIGGHPRFHEGFVRLLSATHEVHSAPHVDFHEAPCGDWGRHVRHWVRQVERAGRPVALVGVSFGAHVAIDVRRRLPRAMVGAVVLVSHWPLTPWQRAALRAVRRLRGPGPRLAGEVFFRWSERQSADVAGLRALRAELYDDEGLVRRRLFARLTSLADAPELTAVDAAHVAHVYGDGELARRKMPAGATVVTGDHSVSLHGTAELAAAVRGLTVDRGRSA